MFHKKEGWFAGLVTFLLKRHPPSLVRA
jgi:hypothetical protein